MEVWLLRHAKAEPDAPSGRDFDRPLSAQGEAACQVLHQWLSEHLKTHPGPQTILHSPALRTTQTAYQVTADLPLPKPIQREALWAATASDWIDLITQMADSPGPLLCVGHNPGLEQVIAWLARPLPVPGMKPGTLVRLDLDVPLHGSAGELLEVIQPNERM